MSSTKSRTLKGLVLTSDGRAQVRTLAGEALADMQKIVGGYIELVTVPAHGDRSGASLYVNEDGKRLGLPQNPRATDFCRQNGVGLAADDGLCGDVLIMGPPEDSDDTDVPDWVVRQLTAPRPAHAALKTYHVSLSDGSSLTTEALDAWAAQSDARAYMAKRPDLFAGLTITATAPELADTTVDGTSEGGGQ